MKLPTDASKLALLLLATLTCRGAFAAAKGDITESVYDKKLREAQESAFSPWMPAKDAFEQCRLAKLGGKLLLAAERNSNAQIRLLLFFPPDGKGGDVVYETDVPEEILLERHVIWQKQNYNILFARKNPSGNYSALWINSARFDVALKRLTEVGISPPIIRAKPGQAVEVPVAAQPITAPLQAWHDKNGRALQASVSGIQSGTVNFVRSDGIKFSFPLADLSDADQKRLAELQSSSTKRPDPKGSTEAEGLTNWMSRSDFETRLVEERAKDKYVVYSECNNRNEIRGIFDKRPAPVRWFQAWAEPEQSLREKHSSYVSQGFSLLSLSHDRRTDRYCAIWVEGMPPGDMKGQLGKFGITSPSIGDKITACSLSKR